MEGGTLLMNLTQQRTSDRENWDTGLQGGLAEISVTHGSLGPGAHVSQSQGPGTSAPAPNPTCSGVLVTIDIGQLILMTQFRSLRMSSPVLRSPWGLLSECRLELGQLAARLNRREGKRSSGFPHPLLGLCKSLCLPCLKVVLF